MKVKRCSSTEIEVYKLDVWIKQLSGKRKLSLLVKKDDQEKDRECLAYRNETLIELHYQHPENLDYQHHQQFCFVA